MPKVRRVFGLISLYPEESGYLVLAREYPTREAVLSLFHEETIMDPYQEQDAYTRDSIQVVPVWIAWRVGHDEDGNTGGWFCEVTNDYRGSGKPARGATRAWRVLPKGDVVSQFSVRSEP